MLEFKLLGIKITVSFWFLAAISFFLLYERAALFFYFAAPILVHELGHIAALYLCGGKISKIDLRIFGIDMCPNTQRLSYPREIFVIMAGIICNLLTAGLLFLQRGQTMRSMLLIAVNLAVAGFNLLPIGNLDGGALLRLIGERLGESRKMQIIARGVSFALLLPLFVAAFYILLKPERNYTLLIVCVYLLFVIVIDD